jgi:hypothetical protein
MCGHGSPTGLFSVGQFKTRIGSIGYVINNETVPFLQNKECILIWCNADVYFHTYKLKGFSTSMFISEVGEAHYCGLPNTPQNVVDESNNTFALEMGSVINKPINEVFNGIKQSYGLLAESNPVAQYNWRRFHLN